MRSSVRAALVALSLAGCGAASKEKSMNDSTTVAQFTVSSEDIRDGQTIAAVYTCDGANQSPQLSWPEPPAGTRSLALVMDDPDAPNGTFRHWAVFNMPDTRRSMERGEGNGPSSSNFVQATNDFGNSGYGGPCPPKGHGPHRYRFKLYALDVDGLKLAADAKVEQVEEAATQHQVAVAQITGTYERK
jgi:Raf kinase inhibitor-like YbhB/YbcL family protein